MQPANASNPLTEDPSLVVDAFRDYLAARGHGSTPVFSGARTFMARWPEPGDWLDEPLEQRVETKYHTTGFILFLMLTGRIHGDYGYLLNTKLTNILSACVGQALETDLLFFLGRARTLGFSERVGRAMTTGVVARVLLHTGSPLCAVGSGELEEFETACRAREQRTGRSAHPYLVLSANVRRVLFHAELMPEPAPKPDTRATFSQRMETVHGPLAQTLERYLERKTVTCVAHTVSSLATRLAHFGAYATTLDPDLSGPHGLERCRHIEPYLIMLSRAPNTKSGGILSPAEQARRIHAVSNFLREITEWGWPDAPARQLLFRSDIPRLPRPLPRYLPPDSDRMLARALVESSNRLAADALLLQRACGLRIGELLDLEMDCVHQLAGNGAWLKVPLGKMKTERMVPLDEDSLALLDRIIATRSPGQAITHPVSGKPVQFLFTHYGKRLQVSGLRNELDRAAASAGLGHVTTHQLRHTYATALINAGVTLQALMSLLGHVSAEMSLRYASLFDSTVRTEYERALDLAKTRIGTTTGTGRVLLPIRNITDGNWRETPTIKSRLAGGYCLRALAQEACPYANICEHCPSFRTENSNLPVLEAQRKDAALLAQDARGRGWDSEARRHQALVAQLEKLIDEASPA
ncbi:tyrosine-type recombinase/integrase [Paeniglutamicibacter cryotolerans]|uniref:Integrase n=1 Tax=Paeniglutamicibacter cryotolerans TaxID=670079 RepID=A0A839QKU3_9MICC|nr:site-specific integrase [Paeniglutamicibacter cryotolerans]MBB2996233.1 integrase [Paeniglutamicibacter cryotolerans]